VASIDLGIDVLASVVIDGGACLLCKGVRTEEDYFYLERRISGVKSPTGSTSTVGEQEARDELSREERRLFHEADERD